MLPFLEVSHLPSSSSFYSAVTQPLGLRYLSTEPTPFLAVTYGIPHLGTPVFQVRQAAASGNRSDIYNTNDRVLPGPDCPARAHIVLTAPSAAAVQQFRALALRANPHAAECETTAPLASTASTVSAGCHQGSRGFNGNNSDEASAEVVAITSVLRPGGESRARICDFDGNIMEVVYVPPPAYPAGYGGPTIRRTQSTNDEVSRILDWNYGVTTSATSSHPLPGPRGPPASLAISRQPQAAPPSRFLGDDEPYTVLRRSVTTTSSVYEPTASPRQNSSGLSAGAVVGTLLGAAAGAALTYTMIKNDRARAPQQDFDPPPFQRRATFPDPYPDRRGRFVEVERTVEKVRYPDNFTTVTARHNPPQLLTRYGEVDVAAPRSREVDDIYDDRRSRHSSRYRVGGGGSGVRTRSEAPLDRAPLLIAGTEHRSYASSKHSAAPPRSVHRSNYDAPERESYVSARSQRTSSTIRAPPPAPVQSQVVARSKAGSRVTTTTIKVSGNTPSPRVLSRAGSYLSAREVPLPPSGVGSSHANWDDDADSIAPSDSISCVGSRRSARSYRG